VLITSRVALHIGGEHTYSVPPLATPDPTQLPPLSELAATPAVALFVARARAVRHGFVLTEQNAAAVTQVCARLDGLPLALELAAARMRALSAEQLAARLDDRFRMLTDGDRTALPRQRTLRATLDWSYNLLVEPEQMLLLRLAVFAGGWTLAAAEAVCAGESIDAIDVLDLLTALVDKSLVVLHDDEGEARYRLLETVRAYAREKLLDADAAEREAVLRRHAEYYLTLAEEAEPQLRGPEQQDWMSRLTRDHDNLRAALAWSAESGEATTGLRLAGALAWFWYIRGHFGEGRRWLDRFLAEGTRAPPAVRAKALQGAAIVATMLGDGPAVRRLFEQTMAYYQELGDWHEHARALYNLGNWIYQWEADYETGQALIEEALAIGRQHPGAERLITRCLSGLGFVNYLRGDTVTARRQLQEALARERALANPEGIGMSASMLARVIHAQGDAVGALALQAESLTLRRGLSGAWSFAFPLAGIAELALAGHPAFTARLLGVLDTMDALRGGLPLHYRSARAAMADAALCALGDAAFEAARAAGRSLPLEQAVAEALAFVTTP
jgi:non-specific serine/threonine protein kinase